MPALDGLLIADFTRVLAGPYATMLLADLGAQVIKVERPGVGDDTRAWAPPFDAGGHATYFQSVNRNKRSVTLDLAAPTDVVLARELAARADVMMHNFRPGHMSRYGLDYPTVSTGNPGIVYAEISGFGDGAGAALPGYDLLVQAVGGLMSITGEPGEPTKVGVALVDVLAGLHATIGVLAALESRHRTGLGQLVTVNLLGTLLSSMVNQSAAYVGAGVIPGPLGNAHPSVAPYQPFATADQPIVVAAGNDGQFRKLCVVLGQPELADDEKFATNPARVTNRVELSEVLTVAFSAAGAAVWQEQLTAVGVPCGPINDIGQAFALAESLGLHPMPGFGALADAGAADNAAVPGPRTTANPITLTETPVRYVRPAPELGADNQEVRAWLADPAGESRLPS